MSEHLPEFIDALRLARQGAALEGHIPLSRMPRLGQSLRSQEGDVGVQLSFGADEQGIPTLRGMLASELEMICQRCLEPMRQRVDVTFALGLVGSEAEAQRLPEGYEPLIVGDKPLSIVDLVEDELILALPIVALHDEKACPAADISPTTSQAVEPEARKNPFAVLGELKTKH